MKRRFLILSFAVGLLALGGLNAQAGQILLPSALPPLEISGNYALVGDLEFYNFTYSPTPPSAPPPAALVTVNSFLSIPGEPGISFNGVFTAGAGTSVDYAISYDVTTTDGKPITDAYLSIGGFTNNGGTGSVSIAETIFNLGGTQLSKANFAVYGPGQSTDTTALLPPATTIVVEKDIVVNGGSNGATFSFVNQGFSTAIPEPASMALLGIGLSGLFTLRRLFKRTSVA